MKRSRFSPPSVNAGSMADIAFLLLIFFLVTAVIPDDKGLNRKLPRPCPLGQKCSTDIHERNILRIAINGKNEIMVEDVMVSMESIKQLTMNFVDNNGDGSCAYCQGNKLENLSENPQKAVISLQVHPQSKYDTFIAVQDELTKAFYELRSGYMKKVLRKNESELTNEDIKRLKEAYPFVVSEAETSN